MAQRERDEAAVGPGTAADRRERETQASEARRTAAGTSPQRRGQRHGQRGAAREAAAAAGPRGLISQQEPCRPQRSGTIYSKTQNGTKNPADQNTFSGKTDLRNRRRRDALLGLRSVAVSTRAPKTRAPSGPGTRAGPTGAPRALKVTARTSPDSGTDSKGKIQRILAT